MDYESVLRSCKDPAVGIAVIESLYQLFEKDFQLLNVNAAERTIAAKLAQYLQTHFADYHVDVEYNRMGDIPKALEYNENKDRIYPDIIVHKRATDENVLVIEVKKDTNPQLKDDDIGKLQAIRRELGYSHALFLRLGVGAKATTVCECEWVYV